METEPLVNECTLYVNNLSDRVPKSELKVNLYFLFSQFGEVLDIVTKKTAKLRGQAFVVFSDSQAAEVARKQLNNFDLFDKQMRINFARKTSDVIALREGTFKFKDRKELAEKNMKDRMVKEEEQRKKLERAQEREGTNILMASNLPPQITEELLGELFGQYPGYKNVRLVPTKNFALIEYDDYSQASLAKKGLHGFKMTADKPLNITYAKLN